MTRVDIADCVAVDGSSTTPPGMTDSELARVVGRVQRWLLHGERLVDPEGLVIAQSIEEAAAGMRELGWFGTGIARGIVWSKVDQHGTLERTASTTDRDVSLASAASLRAHLGSRH